MADPAFPNAYTDPNITVRNPPSVAVPEDPPFVKNQEVTPVYDPANMETETFVEEPPKAASGNTWLPGRDPYKNGGAVGQDFLKNSGDS